MESDSISVATMHEFEDLLSSLRSLLGKNFGLEVLVVGLWVQGEWVPAVFLTLLGEGRASGRSCPGASVRGRDDWGTWTWSVTPSPQPPPELVVLLPRPRRRPLRHHVALAVGLPPQLVVRQPAVRQAGEGAVHNGNFCYKINLWDVCHV